MLLRHRLALLIVVTLLLALLASLVLTDVVFGEIQHRQSVAAMERELARVQAVVRSGALGQDIVATGMGSLSLQFVTGAGRVALPEPDGDAIALHGEPTVVRSQGSVLLVASAPWVLPSGFNVGTIRLALDLQEIEASRRVLRVSLVVSGLVILLFAAFGALFSLRASLGPLLGLAEEAERVDPADPRLARYQGPPDEVGRVAAALNRAIDGIRARQQAERDALAEVAHELAGPLTVVAGQLRALAAAHPHDDRLLAARAAADELLHTSQDLLTLARGELDAAPEMGVVDVAEIVRQIVAEYPGASVDTMPGDTRVLADAGRLRQVVRNLVRNAAQASGSNEGVVVRVRRLDDHVGLKVEDDGSGLSEEALRHVFDRYYSGTPGTGAGVGLTVARRIVTALEGSIDARSTPGAGSTFTVTLPSLASRLEREEAEHEQLAAPALE